MHHNEIHFSLNNCFPAGVGAEGGVLAIRLHDCNSILVRRQQNKVSG